eukprot:TRINITY_DN35495_c0_g1_i1.p1 TRINITY_DN35495_c0_g1~~TRINITY_DN35495_c0_g1_i1.p1  ORF type:complete len:562 (-),score=77.58 TRINITY_DN35495_c0_g1_i1:50-1735(-)
MPAYMAELVMDPQMDFNTYPQLFDAGLNVRGSEVRAGSFQPHDLQQKRCLAAKTEPPPAPTVATSLAQLHQVQHRRLLGLGLAGDYSLQELEAAFQRKVADLCRSRRSRVVFSSAETPLAASSVGLLATAFEALVAAKTPAPPPSLCQCSAAVEEACGESCTAKTAKSACLGRSCATAQLSAPCDAVTLQWSNGSMAQPRHLRRSKKEEAQANAGRSCRAADVFNGKLCRLLKLLPAASRRTIVAERLSQAQRLSLERHMLRSGGASQGSSGAAGSEGRRALGTAVRGAFITKTCSGLAYTACVHLGYNLYVQSQTCRSLEAASRGLADLLQLRVKCADPSRRSEQALGAFSAQLEAASMQASEDKCSTTFYFRARASLNGGAKLSTPLRRHAAAALRDRSVLMTALAAPHNGDAQALFATIGEAWAQIWRGRHNGGRLPANLYQWCQARCAERRIPQKGNAPVEAVLEQIAQLLEQGKRARLRASRASRRLLSHPAGVLNASQALPVKRRRVSVSDLSQVARPLRGRLGCGPQSDTLQMHSAKRAKIQVPGSGRYLQQAN